MPKSIGRSDPSYPMRVEKIHYTDSSEWHATVLASIDKVNELVAAVNKLTIIVKRLDNEIP